MTKAEARLFHHVQISCARTTRTSRIPTLGFLCRTGRAPRRREAVRHESPAAPCTARLCRGRPDQCRSLCARRAIWSIAEKYFNRVSSVRSVPGAGGQCCSSATSPPRSGRCNRQTREAVQRYLCRESVDPRSPYGSAFAPPVSSTLANWRRGLRPPVQSEFPDSLQAPESAFRHRTMSDSGF